MMKRYIYNTILCIALLFATVSCDDYLDIKPKGVVIPENCEDYEKLLNYAQLMKASESYPNYMTDDIYLDYEDMLGLGMLAYVPLENPKKNLFTFSSDIFGDGETDGLWEYSYNRIYTYNVIIQNVMGSAEATEEHKRQVRAEALVGRAFEYLTLVNAYARHYDPATASEDPGVPLLLDEDINKTNLQRASVQEIYDQIEKDLDEAAASLPDKPSLNAFRASKPVGYGMKARMYLYMGDYQKALENAKLSLQSNSSLLDLKQYSVVNPLMTIGRTNVPDRGDNPENIYIRLAPYVYGLSMYVYCSDDLVSLYDKENDMRYKLFISRELFGMDFGREIWTPFLYANLAMSTPEIYLIAAECEARIGSKENAMDYINTLRDHRIMDNTPLSAATNDEALKIVLDERRKELPMLGCTRLIDLKRLNREPQFAKTVEHTVNGTTYSLEPGDPKYILPIPPNIMRYNPDMQQNPR